MSVLSDAINGAVEVTTATGEVAVEKIRDAAALIGLGVILLFLLLLFLIEPLSATVLSVLLVVVVAYLYLNR